VDSRLNTSVLDQIPDQPACIEARAMMLEGRGHVAWQRPGAVLVYAPQDRVAAVVGRVSWAELEPAIDVLPGDVEVLVRIEDAEHAGEPPAAWNVQSITVHLEGDRVPPPPYPVRVLTVRDAHMLAHVPPDLRDELEQAFALSIVVAAFEQELPVSFCYVAWETESLWDVSIDTLEGWRNRGYAAAAALALMQIMRERGKRAVWAALDTNIASLRAAAALGFRPVGTLLVLTRKAAARPPA
jgi:hypothetical protein